MVKSTPTNTSQLFPTYTYHHETQYHFIAQHLTDTINCIRHITDAHHPILTCDVNKSSTLWYSYSDGHRGILNIIINNTNHITSNTDTPTSINTHQPISFSVITFVSSSLYNNITWGTK